MRIRLTEEKENSSARVETNTETKTIPTFFPDRKLPGVLITGIFNFFSATEVGRIVSTSKSWLEGLETLSFAAVSSKTFWQEKLICDFGCKPEIAKMSQAPKKVYGRLARLRQLHPSKFRRIRYTVIDTGIDYPPLYRETVDLTAIDPLQCHPYLQEAAWLGNFHLVQCLLVNPKPLVSPDKHTLINAAVSGNVALAKWLIPGTLEYLLKKCDAKQEAELFSELLSTIACTGDLKLIQWFIFDLTTIPIKPDQNTLYGAAVSGNANALRWLAEKAPQPVKPDTTALENAVRSGRLAPVLWLIREAPEPLRVKPNKWMFTCAAETGNVSFVQELLQLPETNGIKPDVIEMLERAAKAGSQPLVQWLITTYKIRGVILTGTLAHAAESGNLELVNWLRQEAKAQPGPTLLSQAMESGNLALVMSLLEDPDIQSRSMYKAKELYFTAVMSRNLTLVKWLMLKGPEKFRVKPQEVTLNTALKNNDLPMVRWLMEEAPEHLRIKPSRVSLMSAAGSGNGWLFQRIEDILSAGEPAPGTPGIASW